MRVLVVEDDHAVSHWLGSKLRASGHNCRLADDGPKALQLIAQEAFDVVVLDQMLPTMNGLEVLHRLQGRARPPVLILSANDQTSDRVDGLRAGADDYLGKPFDYTELLLRLEVLTRRQHGKVDERVYVDDLCIDLNQRKVVRAGAPIELTDKEFRLLTVLAEHVGVTVTRTMLLEKVWGYHFDPQTNLIDVHMSKLRTKIDKGHSRALLRTIRSIGYELG